jgi:hypothetical protein
MRVLQVKRQSVPRTLLGARHQSWERSALIASSIASRGRLAVLRHKNHVIAGLDPAIQLFTKQTDPRVTRKGASLLDF